MVISEVPNVWANSAMDASPEFNRRLAIVARRNLELTPQD
jgi:hypothetical protein